MNSTAFITRPGGMRVAGGRAHKLPQPTEAELRAAFEANRPRNPHWPATFEVAMQDPITCRMVRLAASMAARGDLQPTAPTRYRSGPLAPVGLWGRPGGGGIDRKRAASGERDDD